MRRDVWYYCWGEAAAQVPAHLILLWPVTSHPLSAILCLSLWFRFAGILRQRGWGPKEEKGGGEGRLLKGSSQWVQKMSIITVSNRLEWGEKRGHFHLTSSWSSSLPVSSTQVLVGKVGQHCGYTHRSSVIMELKEGSFRNTVLSLLSGGPWSLSPQWLGGPRGPLICAVGTLGCRLAARQCDCLIGCPLKAM